MNGIQKLCHQQSESALIPTVRNCRFFSAASSSKTSCKRFFVFFGVVSFGVPIPCRRQHQGIAYTSAWHLSHRIHECWGDKQDDEQLAGPVEVDETFVGGKRANMSNAKRKELAGTGRGGLGSVQARLRSLG